MGGMTKFAALFDLHYGFERRSGHLVPLHDMAAFGAALAFLEDFKPQTLILGGDILDCGVISHHHRNKPGQTEGMRLIRDAESCRRDIIAPLKALGAKDIRYITGNHEGWLEDFTDEHPGIEGMMDLRGLLDLPPSWKVLPDGAHTNLGKLTFLHGNQLKGGENAAKHAVAAYERSVRFGHFHTFQAATKTSALDLKLGRTGMAIGCLCHKGPRYTGGAPGRWVQGLNFGYVEPNGFFYDYAPLITNGRTIIHGKVYKG